MAVNIDTLIEEQQWEAARAHFEVHPEEASRMVNPSLGWTKLHWLCSMGSTPSSLIDLVASLYPQAITMPDNRYGDTPLHLACRNAQVTVKKPQFLLQHLHNYNQQLKLAGEQVDPPNGFIEEKRNSKNDTMRTYNGRILQGVLTRNRFGGTAMHSACNHNAALEVLQDLVKANPQFLKVTTFDGIPPLSALYTAYIQTIPGYMAVAKRLKGEEAATSGHFDRFWQKVVFLTTAEYQTKQKQQQQEQQQLRLTSAKEQGASPVMELDIQPMVPDPTRLVLHGLLHSGHLLVNFYKLALKHDPSLATVTDAAGDLPLHLLIRRRPFRLKEREAVEATLLANPRAACVRNHVGDFALLAGIRNKMPWSNGLDLLVQIAPFTVQRRDEQSKLLPFQLAAAVGGKVALDTTFHLLTIQPDLLVTKTCDQAPSPPPSPVPSQKLGSNSN